MINYINAIFKIYEKYLLEEYALSTTVKFCNEDILYFIIHLSKY